jgi:lipoate-protein ligase B
VTNDLSLFDCIVPCGLHDVTMTSLAHERASERCSEPAGVLFDRARDAVAAAFQEWLA